MPGNGSVDDIIQINGQTKTNENAIGSNEIEPEKKKIDEMRENGQEKDINLFMCPYPSIYNTACVLMEEEDNQ